MGKGDSDAEAGPGRTLTARIADDLGRAIVTGRIGVSAPFPVEAELCRRYSASRPVVREAVKMLTAKGILRARQRAGTAVEPEARWNLLDPDLLRWLLERDYSIELLVDFTRMRMAIEPRAAGLAATGASEAQRGNILTAIERMAAAEAGRDDPLEADIGFHTAVLLASNNRFMRQFRDLSETALRFSIRRTNALKRVTTPNVAEHRAVADAIVAREPAEAAARMAALLRGALDLLLADAGLPGEPDF
ncbi:FadR/GntR family transcriptional regulator [Sphingomonas sp. ASV193]|uniref:FadR/GntR family transcriptional regulator n=1 Tax=Sphingomonas sp. ASV193 TaxID=3144405 RepID=UPI0032E8DE6B